MKIAIGDADSLVAMAYKNDINHERAKKINEWLLSQGYQIIYPNTAILEAVTALRRALNSSETAHLLNSHYQQDVFNIYYIDQDTQIKASLIFGQTKSKKNTIFDALVVSVAEKLNTDVIFSFDNWYHKLGLKIAQDML